MFAIQFFSALLAFGSVLITSIIQNCIHCYRILFPLGVPTQKNHAFKQCLNHRDFETSFQDLLFFKRYLEP